MASNGFPGRPGVELVRVSTGADTRLYDREKVLGRDTSSVFPNESKKAEEEARKAAAGAIGGLRFVTEGELKEEMGKGADAAAVNGDGRSLAEVLRIAREKKEEEFQVSIETTSALPRSSRALNGRPRTSIQLCASMVRTETPKRRVPRPPGLSPVPPRLLRVSRPTILTHNPHESGIPTEVPQWQRGQQAARRRTSGLDGRKFCSASSLTCMRGMPLHRDNYTHYRRRYA